MKLIKWFGRFIFKYSGLEAVVSSVESSVLNYKLRVRMVPTSYKAFICFLGVVIGASGMYVSLSYENVLERNTIIIENAFASTQQVETVKELTIEEKIAKAFPENPKVMIAIAKAESGLNPMAAHKNTNGTHDTGLFQVNSIHGYSDLDMLDVDKNIAAARAIYEKQGIVAWSTFNNNSFSKFLD